MIGHFEGIKFQDGNVDIKMPNSIFKTLSTNIKSDKGRANSLQISFTYSYLVAIAFLYRFTYYIDMNNETYIQNGDIKELLGYSKTTKSVNKIIKKGGITDILKLTETTKDCPIAYIRNPKEKINGIPIIEYLTIMELKENKGRYNINYNKIENIVKNKNYEVKEPLFLTTRFDDNEYGTSYSLERTHAITIDEFIRFISDKDLNNISFMIYGYLKSICKGYKNNERDMALYKIVDSLGIDKSVFFDHLKLLKGKGFINVIHKEWVGRGEKGEANTYIWRGV